MKILVNASNLKIGGGLQVADSFCRELYKYTQHEFYLVYPKALEACAAVVEKYNNVKAFKYEIPTSFKIILTGRCRFLDSLVYLHKIDAVLTIFGPSMWRPKIPHLSGFAQGHIVLPDSPFWQMLSFKKRFILWVKLKFVKFSLNKSSNSYYTENQLITNRLQQKFPQKKIFTVTNNANQIFQQPEKWDRSFALPKFNGITLLTVAANYPHKNLSIIIPTCHYLEEHFPTLCFRFILTIYEKELDGLDDCVRKHVVFLGPVNIEQVPYLYEQCDIMFLPTLLECFSASYAEAMIMRKPILTSDLVFAHGLCGIAACYYDPTSSEELGKAIELLSCDNDYRNQLVEAGDNQILTFDTFSQRAQKLIRIVEELAKK